MGIGKNFSNRFNKVVDIKTQEIESIGDSFEKLTSVDQGLTFEYAETLFAKIKLPFGRSQKKALGIIGENNLYSNLALLISEQCNHTLKIGIFEGKDKGVFKDRKEFTGSILKQVKDAFDYIELNNRTRANFAGLLREDRRDYPVEAIREALLNTVVHRDYTFSSSTIVNIYEDRMEFLSLGGIVEGLSLESIMLGISQSRNPKLASLLYKLNLIESFGTGIQKIIKSYDEYRVKPVFKAEQGVFVVSLPNVSTNFVLNQREEEILKILTSEEKTRKELEEITSLSKSVVSKSLKLLQDLNLIEKHKIGRFIKYKVK